MKITQSVLVGNLIVPMICLTFAFESRAESVQCGTGDPGWSEVSSAVSKAKAGIGKTAFSYKLCTQDSNPDGSDASSVKVQLKLLESCPSRWSDGGGIFTSTDPVDCNDYPNFSSEISRLLPKMKSAARSDWTYVEPHSTNAVYFFKKVCESKFPQAIYCAQGAKTGSGCIGKNGPPAVLQAYQACVTAKTEAAAAASTASSSSEATAAVEPTTETPAAAPALDVGAVAGTAGALPKPKLKFGEWMKNKGEDGKGLSNGGKAAIGAAAVVAVGTAIGLGVANAKQKKKGAEKYSCPSGYKLKKKFMGKVANAKAWSCVGPCASSIEASIDGQSVTLSGGKKKFLSKKCKFSFAGAVSEGE